MASVSNAASGAIIWQANTMDKFGHGVNSTHIYDNVRGVLTGLGKSGTGVNRGQYIN